MTPENIIAFVGVLVTLIGGFTALFTALFGASKTSFNQLSKAFDELKSINEGLRADNVDIKKKYEAIKLKNVSLVRQIHHLQEQVRKLTKALAEAVATVEKINRKEK